jgi:hypothetical protein
VPIRLEEAKFVCEIVRWQWNFAFHIANVLCVVRAFHNNYLSVAGA